MADTTKASEPAVTTCTPADCAACPVPIHTKAMCQAILAWKIAVNAINEQRTSESAAVVAEELRAFYVLCLTHGINAGLLLFEYNIRAMLAHIGELTAKLAMSADPASAKRAAVKLLVDLFGKPGAGARPTPAPDKPIVH